jgi:hypothetical protein
MNVQGSQCRCVIFRITTLYSLKDHTIISQV